MLQRTPEENILQSRQRRRIKLYQEQSELLLIVSVLWMLLSLLDEMRPMLSADMTQQLKLPIVSICAFAELVRLLLTDAKSDWPSTPRFLCRLISICLISNTYSWSLSTARPGNRVAWWCVLLLQPMSVWGCNAFGATQFLLNRRHPKVFPSVHFTIALLIVGEAVLAAVIYRAQKLSYSWLIALAFSASTSHTLLLLRRNPKTLRPEVVEYIRSDSFTIWYQRSYFTVIGVLLCNATSLLDIVLQLLPRL
jgi:hypothetical protein